MKGLVVVLLLVGCGSQPVIHSLPHRPIAELFPQAYSPPAECPGQYHEEVFADGNFFLYCWGRDN